MSHTFRFLFGLCLLAPLALFAQQQNTSPNNPTSILRPSALENSGSTVSRYFYPVNPDIPLEGPIDPDEYICGANDLFTISVGGFAPQQQVVPVTVEGKLLIPGVEPVNVLGKTLTQVRREAEASIKRVVGNYPVEVSLSQPRSFSIAVFGGTPGPEMRAVSAVSGSTRVASVVKRALTDQNELQKVLAYGFRPSIRTIQVRRKNGTVLYPDLARFYTTGDLKYNPPVQEGDQIFIPSFNFTNEVINVQGDMPYPGTYPIRPDDTLLDILIIAAGTNGLNKHAEVRLTHFDETSAGTSEVISIPDLLARRVPNPKLKPRDLIYIPHRWRENGSVSVEGEVEFPGPYPMTSEKVTLREVLRLSGGLRATALPKIAYIERNKYMWDPGSTFSLPIVYLPGQQTPQYAGSQIGRLGDLDFASRLYLEREMLSNTNRIPLNLEEVLKEGAPDVLLVDGDRLIIPRDQHKVAVIGEVVQKGQVDWKPNQTVDYYIAQAGGRGDQATFAYVIKAGSGQLVDGYKVTSIESGDLVFVNRKQSVVDSPELQRLAAQRRADTLQRVSTFITAISTAVSITATIIYLTRSSN